MTFILLWSTVLEVSGATTLPTELTGKLGTCHMKIAFYTPAHDSGMVLWLHIVSVCSYVCHMSVRLLISGR